MLTSILFRRVFAAFCVLFGIFCLATRYMVMGFDMLMLGIVFGLYSIPRKKVRR
jgi:hypothetical protein